MKQSKVQTALRVIYPPRCTICGDLVESDFALCGPCWRDTPLIAGACCDKCGAPLPGEAGEDILLCDDCMRCERPWCRGRAVLLYRDNGRRIVLALKHGDRHEIVRPAAAWMVQKASPLLTTSTLVAPIPLHWSRMLRRTYNQAALLSTALARQTDLDHCPDLLVRGRRTPSLKGKSRQERFAVLDGVLTLHPRRSSLVAGRDVLLVDDVMTSGATLSAAAQACFAGGAASVNVLVLARAVKDA